MAGCYCLAMDAPAGGWGCGWERGGPRDAGRLAVGGALWTPVTRGLHLSASCKRVSGREHSNNALKTSNFDY